MICIKVSPLHKQIWWDNMLFLFVDGFQGEENESNNFGFGASLKASGILPVQPAARRCYCRLCSREELSSPQVFAELGTSQLTCTAAHRAIPSRDNARCHNTRCHSLPVQAALGLPPLGAAAGTSRVQKRPKWKYFLQPWQPRSTEAVAAPRARKKYFPQIKERFFPWHWGVYTALSTSKFPLQKNQKETNETLGSVCFCKTKPRPHSRRENMVSSSHKLLLSNQMQCVQMVPEDLKTVL